MTRAPAGLAAAVAEAMAAAPEGPIGVAVSGGGDSVALLLLLADWARGAGRGIAAITIDHRLRPEAAAEAAEVGRLCARRGIVHHVRVWDRGDPRGNLQQAARDARRAMIADWAHGSGISAVALGHTLDDQAETFLMRVARGSGVDGLSAMSGASRIDGLLWLRPLLGRRRAELRDWLQARGVGWAEDPGNADPAYDRVRARAALPVLGDLGLGPERLAATARRMARARAALEAATRALAVQCLVAGAAGDLTLDPAPLCRAQDEIGLRLLASALCWVAGEPFCPRMSRLETLAEAVARGRVGRGLTLHGCVLRLLRDGRVAIRREPARVAAPVPAVRGVWDRRWRVTALPEAAQPADLTIGPLGAKGIAARPDWRATGLSREALATTPALWSDGRLVAAPLLDPAGPLRVERIAPLAPPWSVGELR